MNQSTTSSGDTNLRARCACVPISSGSPQSGLRADVVQRGRTLAADPNYPPPEVIRQLIRQIFLTMEIEGPDDSMGEG